LSYELSPNKVTIKFASKTISEYQTKMPQELRNAIT